MNKRLSEVLSGREANYMLPFYWQHGDHYETIPEEVERIYNSGCRALCVESRPHKDFVGETWWRDMDLILAEAKKRNMKVWILDDDHFPTGHAAGHIAKYHPELRRWQIAEFHVDVIGPLKDAMLIAAPTAEGDELLCAYAYPRTDKGENCKAEPICLTENIHGKFLHFSIPEGCWRIFFVYKTRNGTTMGDYIDMLSEESVRVLIDAVYEPHYEHYKEYFGSTIAGFFSDEPALGNTWAGNHHVDPGMYNRRIGMPGLALPWNERMIGMMSDILGYDASVYLPALWYDIEGITENFRHAYMDVLTRLYRDCFTRQLGDWCQAHGVQYIGHIIEDMNAHARTGCSAGHYYRSLDGQHMSGIDIVLHQLIPGMDLPHNCSCFGNDADPEFYDYVLAKLASSYAHVGTQMEGRAMCEMYGAYGWAEGTPVMKWLLDYLLVRGVNHFVPHAFTTFFPDPDCPPHFGINGIDPQFEGFSTIMHYGNQAAHLLYGNTHVADAAILYHADAEWMNKDGHAMLVQKPAKILYDAHIDFDILPGDCFTSTSGSRVYHASADNGRLRVGNEIYKYLIVPAADVLPAELTAAFEELKDAGVPIFRIGKDVELEDLLTILQTQFSQDITIEGNYPKLRCCHYKNGASDIYMFANESVTTAVDSFALLSGIGDASAVVLDLLNDEVSSVVIEGGRLPLTLAPYQSVIVVAGDTDAALPAKKNWTKSAAANLTFQIETAPYTALNEFAEYASNVKSDELFSITGIDHMPDFSGRIRYTASFDRTEITDGTVSASSIAIDLGEVGQTAHLWLNGKDLGVRVCPPYRYDLTDALCDDTNELVIEVSNTLGNAVRDAFSPHMVIPASGLIGEVCWMIDANE